MAATSPPSPQKERHQCTSSRSSHVSAFVLPRQCYAIAIPVPLPLPRTAPERQRPRKRKHARRAVIPGRFPVACLRRKHARRDSSLIMFGRARAPTHAFGAVLHREHAPEGRKGFFPQTRAEKHVRRNISLRMFAAQTREERKVLSSISPRMFAFFCGGGILAPSQSSAVPSPVCPRLRYRL